MLSARVAQNIAVFLIVFLAGMLILIQAVYSASDSGHNDDIMWDIYVGALSHESDSTYSSHSYQIELYSDMSASVQATYEFAHFVHDLTLGTVPEEVKDIGTGAAIKKQYKWDGESEELSVSVGHLDSDHIYKLEGYTRLEIRKGGKLIKVPGKAELKVTEFLSINIE